MKVVARYNLEVILHLTLLDQNIRYSNSFMTSIQIFMKDDEA